MVLDVAILVTVLATGAILLWPRVAHVTAWKAATTPLASIIGSGFLVLGPILNHAYGRWAPAVMAALCIGAWLFGAAIRANIAALDSGPVKTRFGRLLEEAASWSLAFAYVISVAYYLNLFGAFAVDLTPFAGDVAQRAVTTAVFLLIAAVGWLHGYGMLERMEYVSVSLKLAIIAGLLLALGLFFSDRVRSGSLVLSPAGESGWSAIAIAFGLIVTVQGFETARYLGRHYSAPDRIRAMKVAQLLSTAIYMTYIGLIAYVFRPDSYTLTETAVIDLMRQVAPVLPYLLTAAALAAQFSAAVADTGGSGGLVAELTAGRLSARQGYLALTGIGVLLTWTSDVFHIISYASRAFALYYALQAAIAARHAHVDGRGAGRVAGYCALCLFGLAVAVLGKSVEGG